MRFSPVDTGNTTCKLGVTWLCSVQPRGYGEHVLTNSGLAPVKRFSPVDTGNTLNHQALNISTAVQPRGYGEHQTKTAFVLQQGGSAPWIRGTRKGRYNKMV